MTPREAVRELLREIGAPFGDRAVDEVLTRLPAGCTAAVIERADPLSSSIPDVVGAILDSARTAKDGTRPVRARPAAPVAAPRLPAPLPDLAPREVRERGLAGVREALAAARRDDALDPVSDDR